MPAQVVQRILKCTSLSCASAIVMTCRYIFVRRLAWFLLLLHFASLYTSAEASGQEYAKGCAHLQCASGSQCFKRRFWCKNPPCPGMLYCSRTRTESLKGPDTCDTVQCSEGYTCIVKVRGCHWDEKCKQQIARCISEKEYHEGAASCAGFECPMGKRCILRESYCINPPCKLLRSCAEAKDVQIWFDECRKLDCPSEYECFLRTPDNNCINSSCTHTPDCTLTAEDELINKHCRGWICPRMQKCVVRIVGTCKGFNCAIERSCRRSLIASSTAITSDKVAEQPSARKTLVQIETELIRQELGRREMNTQMSFPLTSKPTLTTNSTRELREESTHYVTSQTEISIIHQQMTTKSSPIIASLGSPSNGSYFMLLYPPSWLNYNKLSTTNIVDNGRKAAGDNVPAIAATFSERSENSSFPAVSFTDRKIRPTTAPGDTKRLEALKRIYVASDDVLPLPMVLEGVNFVGQGYPTWIKDELHRSVPSGARNDKKDGGWRYHALQEPYRILLPPYEPVILVKDTRRGYLLPFLTYAFDHPFNEAALISSTEIMSRDTTRNSKTDGTSTTVDDKIDDHVNSSSSIEIGNYSMNHFDDSSGDYANIPAMEKTNQVPSNIRDKELNNNSDDYEWRPWLMTHDYLGKSKPQPVHEQDFESNVDESATGDLYTNDTLVNAEASVESRITDEDGERISETRYAHRHNKRLETFDPPRAPIATGQRDYSSSGEERYDLVNYSYDTVTVRDVDKSRREYQRSPLNEIWYNTSNEETQRGISTTFSADEYDARENERPKVKPSPDVTSPYGTDNEDNQKDDDPEYDEYYSREKYDDIGGIEMTVS